MDNQQPEQLAVKPEWKTITLAIVTLFVSVLSMLILKFLVNSDSFTADLTLGQKFSLDGVDGFVASTNALNIVGITIACSYFIFKKPNHKAIAIVLVLSLLSLLSVLLVPFMPPLPDISSLLQNLLK